MKITQEKIRALHQNAVFHTTGDYVIIISLSKYSLKGQVIMAQIHRMIGAQGWKQKALRIFPLSLIFPSLCHFILPTSGSSVLLDFSVLFLNILFQQSYG